MRRRTTFRPSVETLELRDVPSAVTVQADQLVRILNDDIFGANINSWDGVLSADNDNPTSTTPDPGTVGMVNAAGLRMLRLSNGSGSDSWHFDVQSSNGWSSGAGVLANLTAAVSAGGMVCVNYGTGSPQEAAAYLAYLNGQPGNATPLGLDGAGKDWRTAGFWATLRSQTPLGVNDGYNHLRVGRAAPFGFTHFEVGNEAYFGAWQGYVMPSPVAYAQFSAQFAALAQQIDPNAKVGVGVGNPIEYDPQWNGPMLSACQAAGFIPKFLSDHYYAYDGNNEPPLSDANLLAHTVSDPAAVMPIHANAPRSWVGRAAAYRSLLNARLGAAAANVELMVGEFNSDADGATRQTTALTNGLFIADSLGSLLQTEYNGAAVWNLRNEYTPVDARAGISGWRTGSDNGILGSRNGGTAPQTGPYVPYPAYFAEQLASKLGVTGDRVVPVATDTPGVSAYAVKRVNGRVSILLINKSPAAADTATITVSGFMPAAGANLWQYGQAEDNAQKLSANGASAATQLTPNLAVTPVGTGGRFTLTLPAYSMSLLDLAPANAPPPASAGLFAPPAVLSYPNLGPQTTVVSVGNFDGNIYPDLVVTNAASGGPNTVSVLLGMGGGAFSLVSKVAIDPPGMPLAGRLPEGVVAADIDNDGDSDFVAVLNEGSTNNVVVMRNNGSFTGDFSFVERKTAGTNATHITAADLNGDGLVDLAVSNFGGGVKVLFNRGGTFDDSTPLIPTSGTGGNVIVAADFDGVVGANDLAVANQNDGTVDVFLNNGKGTFTLAATLKSAELGTTFLAARDLDRDGRTDLVASNTFHQPTGKAGQTVSIFYGSGAGTFDPGVTVTVGSTPTGVAVADFTGDAMPDIAVGVESTGKVLVLRSDGGRNYLPAVTYSALAGVNGLAASDFNDDGRTDLVATQYLAGNKLAMLLNQLTNTAVTVTVPAPTPVGAAATFTATVTAAGTAPTTGFVSFMDGDNYLGTVAVANGVAAFTTSTLGAGPHNIRVVYSDAVDLTWHGSSSTAVPFQVISGNNVPPPVTPVPPVTPLPPLPPPAAGGPGPVLVGYRQFAVGADRGGSPAATLLNADGTVRYAMTAFPGLAGGVRTAAGDFTGDGVADLVAGTSPGTLARVRVFDGVTQAELFSIEPFPDFSGGVFVAAGDLDGDGRADLVITPDEGGGPRARVFSGNGFRQLADFFGIEDTNFRGGVRPAIGDITGDGKADLVIAAGFGGGPRVAVFSGAKVAAEGTLATQGAALWNSWKPFGDFLLFDASLRNGAYVAAGDVNGDGFADLIGGGGPGGGPHVKVFSGRHLMANTQTLVANYFAGDVTNRGGVRVAVKNLDGDAKADLVVGSGTGAGSRVTAYTGQALQAGESPAELFGLDAFTGFTGGVFVG